MNRYILDEFHDDPALYRSLIAAAHRERSRALQQGFAWLRGQVKALLTPRIRPRPSRWLARLG